MLPILTMSNLMEYDNSLFDGAILPAGVDRSILVDTILYNYGDMQVLIPDWPIFRHQINTWFSGHREQISRLYRAYTITYNPIWNKDGTITETRTPNLSRAKNGTDGTSISSSRTPNLTQTTTLGSSDTITETGSTEQQTKGFNSSTFQGLNKEIPNTTTTDTRSGVDTVKQSGTDTTSGTGTRTYSDTETETGTDKTIRVEQGNIGVTTTQEMIKAEIALNIKYSFYETVAKMFACDFCVMIY